MQATDFSAALAGHASGRFSEGFSLRRSHLAKDYPMVAPAYAAQRSALAKEIGLGRKPGAKAPAAQPPPAAKASLRIGGRRKAGT